MADCDIVSSILDLKNTTIPVDVIDALQDLLVVTYGYGNKYFQGVLLDSSKRNIPYGINLQGSNDNDNITNTTSTGEDDILRRAVSQRFTYFQNIPNSNISSTSFSNSNNSGNNHKVNINKRRTVVGNRKQNERMTVRLRPRQVLCSNCRSICNENSVNVEKSRTRSSVVKELSSSSSSPSSLSLSLNVNTNDAKNHAGFNNNIHINNNNDETSPPLTIRTNRRYKRSLPVRTPANNNTIISGNSCISSNNASRTDICDDAIITPTLIPKVPRLQPNDITNAINGKLSLKLISLNSSSNSTNNNTCFSRSLNDNDISANIAKNTYPIIKAPSANMKTSTTESTQIFTAIDDKNSFLTSPVLKIPRLPSDPKESSMVTDEHFVNRTDIRNTSRFEEINEKKTDELKTDDEILKMTSKLKCATQLDKTASSTIANENSQIDTKMVLRKKHGVGSFEDLWDESIFEEKKRKSRTTPVLKISFGSRGHGGSTVLKIPSKVNDASESDENELQSLCHNDETEQQQQRDEQHHKQDGRDSKKAEKKARKIAKKKLTTSLYNSQKMQVDDRGRKRHKVKRKKKRKKESTVVSECVKPTTQPEDDTTSDAANNNEKLSISFKRMGDNAYITQQINGCGSSFSDKGADENDNDSLSSEEEEEVDEEVEATEDEENGTDQMELESSDVAGFTCTDRTYCRTISGEIIKIGDVIWGKLEGCAWWPGKVTTFKLSADDRLLYACISWYGSTTSSLMSCDNLSPFLDMYKVCFNKHKKSGQYLKAIRQAKRDANQSVNINYNQDGVRVTTSTSSQL